MFAPFFAPLGKALERAISRHFDNPRKEKSFQINNLGYIPIGFERLRLANRQTQSPPVTGKAGALRALFLWAIMLLHP